MPSSSFVAAFFEMARTRPDAPALVLRDRVIDYAELARLVEAAQAAVDELGIADGVPVCVPAHKSPQTIALIVACVRAGRQVLLPSAGLGAVALADMCSAVGVTHVLGAIACDTNAFELAAHTVTAYGRAVRPVEPGLLLTTSGSTGTPKTVVLSAEGVDRFLAWAAGKFGIGAGVRVLNHAPLNFDLCLLDVWTSLSVGACVELVDADQAVNGTYLAELCARRAPSVIQAVPLFFRLVTDAAARSGQVCTGVREVLCTGDAMPPGLLARVAETFPGARLWNVYGCTETNDSFAHEIAPADVIADGAVPIGTPIDGVDALVLDESGAPVTGAGTGELLVATPFQARGYFDDALNREKWRDGYFRTGDLVRRDEKGLVFLIGRHDHEVKVRGVRTNLQEVEHVVLGHPQVLEAAVVAVPDETAGNVLHAVVRRAPESELDGLGLRVHCAAGLPRTAIPGVIEIVDHALPRTSTGKVDRKSVLRQRQTHPRTTGGTR
jgi:acyl-coenzyme A synthetase/AMP-(fatty) acid ligase